MPLLLLSLSGWDFAKYQDGFGLTQTSASFIEPSNFLPSVHLFACFELMSARLPQSSSNPIEEFQSDG